MKSMTMLLAGFALAGVAQAAEMTVYKQPNFNGASLTLRGDSGNLANQGFHDQVSSIQVRSGSWQVCTQPNFAGECVTLGPGSYGALEQRLNHRIESVREVSQIAE